METALSTNVPRSRPTSTSTSGIRACTNCSRVKCKCIYRADSTICERCYRLKKSCTPTESAGRRVGKRRGVSRTARLEEKLDKLMSSLKSQKETRGTHTEDEVDNHDGQQGALESNTEVPSVTIAPSVPATQSLGGITAFDITKTSSSSISYFDETSPSEAEDLLRKFRDETAGFLPLVYIPPYARAQQLREMYPFLWLTIMCTASTSPRKRTALSEQAKNIVVLKVVMHREKSIDLLLGLLIFVGWSHLHKRDKPFWTLFSQLIVTLVCDLGLHRPPSDPTVFCAAGDIGEQRVSTLLKRRPHEEQRAVLGAFVVTSMISNIFKHAPGLRWSPYLDVYLSNLAQSSKASLDESLTAMVKMQLIANQIYDDSLYANGRRPPPLYLSALRSQLHEITKQENLSAEVRNDHMILELYHFTELLINESEISKPTTPWNEPDLRRFEIYQRCLVSIKAYLDTFFSTPIPLLGNMSFASYPRLVTVMKGLHTLTILQDPSWDRVAVRRTVDLIPTCDKIIGLFEYLKAASTLVSLDGGDDESYNWGLGVFRKLREVWQYDLENADAANISNQENNMFDGVRGGGPTTPIDNASDSWFFNVFDDL
ncbi:hypothetical protein F5Y00DRAFT_271068 [Daldinia vernicosa]|uniref:uncharacterized protein n=1 Tax=Daldinia vernicosa TaxID=114800 RepID=UPI0020087068|nr:uncharacterized protein F5Y00DRAFT_271068 [Daldinia vernicosa]KAI0847512.1 hypothetical protein F5Y00DRAFT_271068 [Daldinia vernicosa]